MADNANPDPAAPAADPAAVAPAPDTVTVSASEIAGLRSELGRVRAAAKAAEEKRAAEQGEWQALAESRERELAELRATAARDSARSAVVEAAGRLRFADPADAVAMLGPIDPGPDGTVDTAALEHRLAAIAAAKPYLLVPGDPAAPAPAAPAIRTGAPAANGGPAQPVEDDPVVDQGRAIFDMIQRRRGEAGAALPFNLGG